MSSIGKGFVHRAAITGFGTVILFTTLQYIIGIYSVINSVPKNYALTHQVIFFNKLISYGELLRLVHL